MRKIFLPPELYAGIQNIDNESKGKLFDVIYRYNLGMDIELEESIKMIFGFFKPFFDNDIQKHEQFCESRKINGSKGGRPKSSFSDDEPKNKGKPKKAKEPKKPTEMKGNEMKGNDKLLYLDKVYLLEKEYNNLIYDYGLNIIESRIEDLNEYIINKCKGKDPYLDHNLTIRKWLKRDGIQKKEHKPQIEVPTTDDYFTSLGFEVGPE